MRREKTPKLVISFHTTTAAMAMEKYCDSNRIDGRIIPLPSEISASCGLAWCTDLSMRDSIEEIMKKASIVFDGIYEINLY